MAGERLDAGAESDPAPAGPEPPERLLAGRGFQALFVSNAASYLGLQISILALPLLAVSYLGASEFEVGILFSLTSVAFLVFGFPAGALIDRWATRRVLVAADVARAVLMSGVPVLWWMGLLAMWQMYVIGLLVGIATVFFDLSFQSAVPGLVGRHRLVEANTKLESARVIIKTAGPTSAGLLILWITAPVATAVNAGLAAVSAVAVASLRRPAGRPGRPPARGGHPEPLRPEIVAGLRFVRREPNLRAIALSSSMWSFGFGIYAAMMVVFLAREVGLSAGAIGLVFSFAGVGGLVGSSLVQRVVRRFGIGPAMWLSLATTAPFGLFMAAIQPGPLVWAAAASQVVMYAGMLVFGVSQLSFRQAVTPDHMLGRMTSIMRILPTGAITLGAVCGGAAGTWFGARFAILAGVIGMSAAFIPLLFAPLRLARTVPDAVG